MDLRLATVLGLAVVFGSACSGSSAKCVIDTDCPLYERCSAQQCVPLGASADTGVGGADSGPREAGADSGARDSGAPDVGAAPDTGPRDSGSAPNDGATDPDGSAPTDGSTDDAAPSDSGPRDLGGCGMAC